LGTDWGRQCDPNTWVDLCIRIASELIRERPITGVVIPDVRFRNEMHAIRAADGVIIRVQRPGAGLTGEQSLHPSETEQAEIPDSAFDAVLMNDGTLDDLRRLVRQTVLR
jgi:hypothetical protein